MGQAGVTAFDPFAVITDLRSFSYTWGDDIGGVLPISPRFGEPCAVVVGDLCRRALGTLWDPAEEHNSDPCEFEFFFASLEEAWDYVTHRLDDDPPAIHEAAKRSDVKTAERLLQEGEDPNRTDDGWRTPLHVAKDASVVKLLIDAGADVNAVSRRGRTPLDLVRDIESARLLLEAGADPNGQGTIAGSPLEGVSSEELATLLIEAGADVHLRSRTSLLHHVRCVNVARLFLDAGVEVNGLDVVGKTPLDYCEESRQQFEWQAGRFDRHNDADGAAEYARLSELLRERGAKRSCELR